MQNKPLAAKAIITKYGKFLVLVKPNRFFNLPWDHIAKGQGVQQGLIREVSEKTGLEICQSAPDQSVDSLNLQRPVNRNDIL